MKGFPWWTEEQLAFQQEVREFVESVATYEEKTRWTREFPWEIYKKIGEKKFLGAAVPKEYGGRGLGCTGSVILAEEMHTKMPGVGRIVVGNMNGGLMQIIEYGTEEQKKRFLPGIINGDVGAVVITETTAGTDASGISVSAVKEGDHYVLNGKKRFIVGAGVASRYFVYARTSNDPEVIKKHKHLTAFMLYKGTPGFTCEKINEILAFENVQNGSLDFDNVVIPEADRIGNEGDGWAIMMGGLNFERTNIAGATVGWHRLMLNQIYPYSERRVQFGKATIDINENQNKIANVTTHLKILRAAVYTVAHQWDCGEDITIESSAIKKFGAQLALESAKDATQVMGGDGVNRFYPVQNLYEVAKTEHVAGGTIEACDITIFRNIPKKMPEDVQMTRRIADPETRVPVPVFAPVENKVAATPENILKVLADDYLVNPGLHMTIKDLQWYVEGDEEAIQKAVAELKASGDAWTIDNKKTGAAKLVRASYDGLKKAYPKEHYRWFPTYVDETRTF